MKFPSTRLHRIRQNHTIRDMLSENRLTPKELVLPLFIQKEEGRTAIPTLMNQERLGPKALLEEVKEAMELGIHAVALFPVIGDEKRDPSAREALNPQGLIPSTLKLLKSHFPSLILIADIALDPYTSSGQDGILDANGAIDNDSTLSILAEQAILSADSGADIIAPSDMMDGRIGFIRSALERQEFKKTLILAYSAKYASCFYGPFRDAVGSSQSLKGDKRTYQMNPSQKKEALLEAQLDIDEGADILMVKPAMPYLDIIQKLSELSLPVFAYQVSGESAMLHEASKAGAFKREEAILESLICIKRAGASCILTYFAKEVAAMLQK